MLKCPVLLAFLILMVLGALMVVGIQGSPVLNTLAARSTSQQQQVTETLEGVYRTSLASPPIAREERDVSPTPPSPTSPQELPFIKNTQCSLHQPDGSRRSLICGLRQLDLPKGASGIKTWNPSLCRQFHCKCTATKEVHRAKRTIADNRTTLDFHRYRVFECV